MLWYHLAVALLHALHPHLPALHTYGYGGNGGHPHSNAGWYVDFTPDRCVGYEIHGTPGWFGNVLGLRGGDCS